MNRIRIVWLVLFLIFSVAYWVSLNPTETTLAPWALRKSLLYYTGVVAIGMMSIGMVLAMRLQSIEGFLGGLDKHYRLHKWLGVSGVVFALAHWLIKLGPKWLIHQGWAEAATFKTPPATIGFFDHVDFLHPARDLAKDVGEWAIYALLALALIALIKKFPYRAFFKTHRILPLVYLALVFHSVVLFTKLGINSPVGYLMFALMGLGVVGALVSLRGKTGATHRSIGHLTGFETNPSDGVTEVHVTVDEHWPGHEPGQFAFVTFDTNEGAHPFSVSSAWNQQRDIRFHIKQLGDYTGQLPTKISLGQTVIIEGPYGRFDFKPVDAKQIWIAAGIGVTPFLSRLQALGEQAKSTAPNSRPVHFYWCLKDAQGNLVTEVRQLCERANVQLTLVLSSQGESLTGERIREQHDDWCENHIWFCGPVGLGQALKTDLTKHGFAGARFHQELFNIR